MSTQKFVAVVKCLKTQLYPIDLNNVNTGYQNECKTRSRKETPTDLNNMV